MSAWGLLLFVAFGAVMLVEPDIMNIGRPLGWRTSRQGIRVFAVFFISMALFMMAGQFHLIPN